MGRKAVAWLEDEDRSGAAKGLAAIADNDQGVITDGDNLRLPPGYPYVYAAIPATEFAAYAIDRLTLTHAKIASNPLIFNKGIALNYLNDGLIYDFRRAPLRLRTGENITVSGFEADEATVAHYLGLALFLQDSPRALPHGKPPAAYHSHVCTLGAMTAGVWTASALTEVNALPEGRYICWGARVLTATPFVARLRFNNVEDRPPLIPVSRSQDPTPAVNFWNDPKYTFKIPDGLPTFEGLLMAADTPSEIELYITKVG